MKFLGIDFGSKKIGLALSDESGVLAFPKEVILNDDQVILTIKKICQEEDVANIVLGESHDLSGEPNKIMAAINSFKDNLADATELPISLEKEFMTSLEARRMPGFGGESKRNPDRKRALIKDKKIFDASAAALILQRFLDRKK